MRKVERAVSIRNVLDLGLYLLIVPLSWTVNCFKTQTDDDDYVDNDGDDDSIMY